MLTFRIEMEIQCSKNTSYGAGYADCFQNRSGKMDCVRYHNRSCICMRYKNVLTLHLSLSCMAKSDKLVGLCELCSHIGPLNDIYAFFSFVV